MLLPRTAALRTLNRYGRAEPQPGRLRPKPLIGDPETVPPKVLLSLCERERVRGRFDCMDTA